MRFRASQYRCGALRSRFFRFAARLLPGLLAILAACNPPPVVDVAASNLDLNISIIDTDASPSDGKVPIIVQFFLNGTYVQLASNATVTCNGVTLTFGGLGYAERVPLVSVGGTYNCAHTRNGVSTNVSVTVPPRPIFTSPSQGASVARSSNLTITYVAGSGSGVRGSAGDGSTGLGGNREPDNGTYTGLDVSSLKAGPGSIGLTREFTLTPSGTGFKSVKISYSSGSDIKITWI